jgi:hypothetical protein
MPEDTLAFQHFHRDAVKTLDILRKAEVELPAEEGTPHAATGKLVNLYRSTLDRVFKELDAALTPDVAFRKGLAELDTVERLRHLLDNLLEAVKRGCSLQNTLTNLNHAGLVEDQGIGQEIKNAFTKEEEKKSPFPSSWGVGKLVNTLLSGLKNVALTVFEIVINALKAMPKYISLKPKPSIGLAGAFPTFSLPLELEAESITLSELFNDLTGRTRQ